MPRKRQGATVENSPAAINAVENERAALDLRKAGASYPQIARQLGYHDASGASKAVHRALVKLTKEPAEDVLALEEARLDDLYRRAFEVVARQHPMLHNGKPVFLTDEVGGLVRDGLGNPIRVEDDTIRLRALDTLTRVGESRRKLLGLDAPTRTELTGKDGEPLALDVRAAAMIEKVERLRAVGGGGTVAEIAARVPEVEAPK